jgi:hypothetical protein
MAWLTSISRCWQEARIRSGHAGAAQVESETRDSTSFWVLRKETAFSLAAMHASVSWAWATPETQTTAPNARRNAN